MRPRSEHKGVPRHSWGRCRVGRALQPVFSGRGPWAAVPASAGDRLEVRVPDPTPGLSLRNAGGGVRSRVLASTPGDSDARRRERPPPAGAGVVGETLTVR